MKPCRNRLAQRVGGDRSGVARRQTDKSAGGLRGIEQSRGNFHRRQIGLDTPAAGRASAAPHRLPGAGPQCRPPAAVGQGPSPGARRTPADAGRADAARRPGGTDPAHPRPHSPRGKILRHGPICRGIPDAEHRHAAQFFRQRRNRLAAGHDQRGDMFRQTHGKWNNLKAGRQRRLVPHGHQPAGRGACPRLRPGHKDPHGAKISSGLSAFKDRPSSRPMICASATLPVALRRSRKLPSARATSPVRCKVPSSSSRA